MPFAIPRRLAILALPALSACEGIMPIMGQSVRLPAWVPGPAPDPVRGAMYRVSHAFSERGVLAMDAAAAARAFGDMEFLAAALPTDGRISQRNPHVASVFAAARPEWRAAFGIPPELPAQLVLDAFYDAWRAAVNDDGQGAVEALRAPIFSPPGVAALNRLGALPPLPNTARAAALAGQALQEAIFHRDTPR